jgi:hypothetical protein
MKPKLKETAIDLRKKGYSYSEIMQKIPVAKSTISDWLHSVGLSKRQKQRLTEKKQAAIRRGAEAKRNKRILLTEEIKALARKEVGKITARELWLMGTMLYWAEGSKEKDYRPGSKTSFTNSDPGMISIFLVWLRKICKKNLNDITFDIYIHELQKDRAMEIINFWAKEIGCTADRFGHVYYKKGNPITRRKNIGRFYHGVLKINVKASSSLNRQIAGWTDGVIESLR